MRRIAAALDFLTESAHRFALPSLNCISYASDGRRGPLAALASAVLLEVIANNALSWKLIFNLKISISIWRFPGQEILAELPFCQSDCLFASNQNCRTFAFLSACYGFMIAI